MGKNFAPGLDAAEERGRRALDRAPAPINPIGLVGFDEPGRKPITPIGLVGLVYQEKPHI